MATSDSDAIAPLLPPEADVVAGAVDYKRRPALRSKHGRWRSAGFIIVVEMAERIAFFGISSNLITFLTGELGQSTATAAINVNAWCAAIALLPILGAVVADSFVGMYYTIVASTLLYILGLCMITLSTVLPSLSCPDHQASMKSAPGCSHNLQMIIFYVALYVVAFGEGGFKPCLAAFGADQFDGEHPEESIAKSSFFNWWSFGLCAATLIGAGVISYIQDNLSWGLGFGIPCMTMVLSLVVFLCGTSTYRYALKSDRQSPFKRIGRVFIAAAKNWRATALPVYEDKEEAHGNSPPCRLWQLRFLDKALLFPPNYSNGDRCSTTDVEEAKSVLRLLPIWAANLAYAIVFSQLITLFTKQGLTMDRSITATFSIPAASLLSFSMISVLIFLPIYDRVFVPVARAFTGRPAGITTLQRIGTGLFISAICMVCAAITEHRRLKVALEHGLIDHPNATVPMSVWWLVPQYALMGSAETFAMTGLQEFFYDQVPDDLRSVGLALYLSIFGVGSLLSSLLVSVINKATGRGGGESWFSDNLNRAHLDYFYWLLAGLSVVGLIFFVVFAKSYKYKKNIRT